MIHDKRKMCIQKNYNKNLNQEIGILDFCMTIFGPYFQKSLCQSLIIELMFYF
jgi:hypothetical protein